MSQPPNIPTPSAPAYFNYLGAAQSARLTNAELRALIRIFEADYPDDLMLRELHILRACNAITRGSTTILQVLSASDTQAA